MKCVEWIMIAFSQEIIVELFGVTLLGIKPRALIQIMVLQLGKC